MLVIGILRLSLTQSYNSYGDGGSPAIGDLRAVSAVARAAAAWVAAAKATAARAAARVAAV